MPEESVRIASGFLLFSKRYFNDFRNSSCGVYGGFLYRVYFSMAAMAASILSNVLS